MLLHAGNGLVWMCEEKTGRAEREKNIKTEIRKVITKWPSEGGK